jgi:hypothetical protein
MTNCEVDMPRFLLLITLGLLAGCNIVITPSPTQPLRVLSATYATNFRTADGTSVICDNRATTLLYQFRYEGQLSSWTSYLEGQTLGQIKGERTFTPDSREVSDFGEQGYEVQYVMSSNFAPYENGAEAGGVGDDALTPQAINVVPVPQPTQIGATKLYLTLEGAGAGDDAQFVSRDIPVIINCP